MLIKKIHVGLYGCYKDFFFLNKFHTQGQSLASVSANEIRESSRWLHCHGNDDDDDTKARCGLWSIQVIQPITVSRIHVHYTSALPSEICMHVSVWDLGRSLRPASLAADVIPVGEGAQVAVCICVCVCVSVCQCMCEQQVCEVSQQDPYIPASKQTCCFEEYTEYTQNKPYKYIYTQWCC